MKKTFLFAAFAAFTLLVSSCGDAEADAKRLADSTIAAVEATRLADSAAAAATEATRLADSAIAAAAAATEATRIADSVAAAADKKPVKKPKVVTTPPTTTPTPKVGGKRPGANN